MCFLQVENRIRKWYKVKWFWSTQVFFPHCVHTKLLITAGLVGGCCFVTKYVYFYLQSSFSFPRFIVKLHSLHRMSYLAQSVCQAKLCDFGLVMRDAYFWSQASSLWWWIISSEGSAAGGCTQRRGLCSNTVAQLGKWRISPACGRPGMEHSSPEHTK